MRVVLAEAGRGCGAVQHVLQWSMPFSLSNPCNSRRDEHTGTEETEVVIQKQIVSFTWGGQSRSQHHTRTRATHGESEKERKKEEKHTSLSAATVARIVSTMI
jgi:hypothetical protein